MKNHSFEHGRKRGPKKAVVFDLDGTLADTNDPEAQHKVNHPDFRERALDARPFDGMVDKVKKAKEEGRDVVILTARSAHYRGDTTKWLSKHDIPYDALIMRPMGDDRKDRVVKKDLLKKDVLPEYKVKKAYDDKSKNVKMFKKEGIQAKKVN